MIFDFLKGYNEFGLYERAVSCERIIASENTDINESVIFRVFVEGALKYIYNKNFVDCEDVDRLTLSNLVNDSKLENILRADYKFKELTRVRELIQKYGNESAHAAKPKKNQKDFTYDAINIIYKLAKCIFEYDNPNEKPLPKKITKDEFERARKNSLTKLENDNLTIAYNEAIREKDELKEKYDETIDSLNEKVEQLKETKEKLAVELVKNVESANELKAVQEKLEEVNRQLQEKENEIISLKLKEVELVEKRRKEKATQEEILYLKQQLKEKEDNYLKLEAYSNEEKVELENQIKELRGELEKTQNKVVLNDTLNFEEEYALYKAKIKDELKEIEDKLRLLAPKCPNENCGNVLRISNSGLWWCENNENYKYAKNRHRNEYHKKTDIEYLRYLLKIPKIKNLQAQRIQLLSEGKNQRKKFRKEIKEEELTKFENIPSTVFERKRNRYFFQSISLPSELFKDRENYERLENYGKFNVDYLTNNDANPIKESRNIYSLMIRMLNRGTMLSTYSETEKRLLGKFGKGLVSKIDELNKYVLYSENIDNAESLDDILDRYIGVELDIHPTNMLKCEDGIIIGNVKSNQKPLLIKKGDKPKEIGDVIVEEISAASDYDCEEMLRDHFGYEDIEDIENLPVGAKFLISCKLVHQIAIAITRGLEMGHFSDAAKFELNVNTALFVQEELDYILKCAIEELKELYNAYARIYGVELKGFTNDGESVRICVGNKKENTDVLIRDTFFENRIKCEIKKIDIDFRPKNLEENVLTFILNYAYGFESFREKQYEGIKALLSGENTLVLLPTGAGKSMIYQLASLIVPGIIVVISPLKSLIIDQVTNLKNRYGQDNVVGIISGSSKDDREKKKTAREKMKRNSTSLLYVAPERLQIPSFREDAKEMQKKNAVFAVVVDEAHCVSEWGHDFRPAYLNISSKAKTIFSSNGVEPTVFALTGTASKRVRDDIKSTLSISNVIYPESFDRGELNFIIDSCDVDEKISKIEEYIIKMPSLLNQVDDDFYELKGKDTNAGIIFMPNAKAGRQGGQYSVIESKKLLANDIKGIKFAEYCTKAPDDYDNDTWEAYVKQNAESFKHNKVNILIATKAFGMGVDKENIRFTIHSGISSSIESFYQEVGRAGRDRKKANGVIIFSDRDKRFNEKILTEPDLEKARKKSDDANDMQDDISKQFYFHKNNFKGQRKESDFTIGILEVLKISDSFTIDDCVHLFAEKESDDKAKLIMQALTRLTRLGIVKDYEFDYSAHEFTVTKGCMDNNSILSHYADFVNGYAKIEVDKRVRSLERYKSKDDFVKRVISELIAFVYEKIERSRREQLLGMYRLMYEVADKNNEEQNRIIRDTINSYFDRPGILEQIRDSEGLVGRELAKNAILYGKNKIYSVDDISEILKIAKGADAELSEYPTHPWLRMLSVMGMICSDESSAIMIANGMRAIEKNVKEYIKEKDIAKDSIAEICNFLLTVNPKIICDVLREIAKSKKSDVVTELSILIKSDVISDENRDYLILCYTMEKMGNLL